MIALGIVDRPAAPAEELEGSAAAFTAFYEAALPFVYGYFLNRCGGSSVVAEDLTQETFLAAVIELRKARRVETPMAWIMGIARHKLLDHYRRKTRQARRLRRIVLAEYQPLIDEDGDAGRDRTVAALMVLPPAQRLALVLCYVDGFAVREVASLLGKSPAAVHSLLERGRAGFKGAYEESAR